MRDLIDDVLAMTPEEENDILSIDNQIDNVINMDKPIPLNLPPIKQGTVTPSPMDIDEELNKVRVAYDISIKEGIPVDDILKDYQAFDPTTPPKVDEELFNIDIPKDNPIQEDINTIAKAIKLGYKTPEQNYLTASVQDYLSDDYYKKIIGLSDKDFEVIAEATLTQADDYSSDIHNLIGRERRIRKTVKYLNSIGKVQAGLWAISIVNTNLFNVPEFVSRNMQDRTFDIGISNASISIEAAKRYMSQLNQKDKFNWTRLANATPSVAKQLLEFAALPNPAVKISEYVSLGTKSALVLNSALKFSLHSALTLPTPGETAKDKAMQISLSTISGAAFGATGLIPNPFIKFSSLIGLASGGAIVQGGDVFDAIEASAFIVGMESVGLLTQGVGNTRRVNKAIEKAREYNPALKDMSNNGIKDIILYGNELAKLQTYFDNGLLTRTEFIDATNKLSEKYQPSILECNNIIFGSKQPLKRDALDGLPKPNELTQKPELGNIDKKVNYLSEQDTGKAIERGFITSVNDIQPELRVEGQYVPRSTDELSIKARNLILDDIVKADKIARAANSDMSVAIGCELLKHYNDLANKATNDHDKDIWQDKARELTIAVAPKLTELGRAVQAASILTRHTPEGQLRFAVNEINKYNEQLDKRKNWIGKPKRLPDITKSQTKHILDTMGMIEQMPEGEAKYIEFNKLQKYISDIIPSSLYSKIIDFWKAGLLTAPITHEVNLLSNVSQRGLTEISNIPATAVDAITSIFTGKREKALSMGGWEAGIKTGIQRGWRYIQTGYDSRDVGLKLDWKAVNYGNTKWGKTLTSYVALNYHILGAEDQIFYYTAAARSLYEQAKVSAINSKLKGKDAQNHMRKFLENPPEKAIANSVQDAEACVFINKTKLSDIAKQVQRLPLGEMFVPFVRTPSAYAMTIVDYSPVGVAKTIITNIGKGNFDQREFSSGLGKGITGIGIMAIGAELYKAGLITLNEPQNDEEKRLWEAEGRKSNSIKVGNKWLSIDSLGVAGNLLVLGGVFQRNFYNSGSPTEAMTEVLSGSWSAFSEQTFLEQTTRAVNAISNPKRYGMAFVGGTVGAFIPSVIGTFARANDTFERRTTSLKARLMSRIPYVREMIEPRIDIFGEEVKIYDSKIAIFLDPTKPIKTKDNPVANELRRLYDKHKMAIPEMLGDKDGFSDLTPKENTDMWKRQGDLTYTLLTKLMDTNGYKKAGDIDKERAITKITNLTRNVARIEVIVRKVKGTKMENLPKLIGSMGKSGLLTQSIANELTKSFYGTGIDLRKYLENIELKED